MAPKYYVLTEQERGLDDPQLAALIDSLDTEQQADQAEIARLEALLKPAKARYDERGQQLMALEREQERREQQQVANAAADKARTTLERDIAQMQSDRSQLAQGLAGVLMALVQNDWWGKKLGAVVDADEDKTEHHLIIFSGRLHAHVLFNDDGSYALDISSSDQQLINLMQQIYAASEQQLRNTYTNHIGFEVRPGVGSRIMAVCGNSAGWGSALKPFETNAALVAQMASSVIDLLGAGTIKVGNSEISRPTSGTGGGGYNF